MLSAATMKAVLAHLEGKLQAVPVEQLPPPAQVLLLRVRTLSAMSDRDLGALLAATPDVSADQATSALRVFDDMFSRPTMRFLALPPAAKDIAVGAVEARLSACRHVLAAGARSMPLPCFVCIWHPGAARCANCLSEHVTGEHDQASELICDWCGAVCMREIFPMPIGLGSLVIVRNLADRQTWHVGPAYLCGLGACYRCHSRLSREAHSAVEVVRQLESANDKERMQ